jgi:hypothetical protein
MNTIYHEIAQKRRQIAADEAVISADGDPQSVHSAKERGPRLRRELEELCTTAHKGEAALAEMKWALNNMVNEMPVGGRELSLAINHAEDALHRLRRHLGTDVEPSKPAKDGAP